MKAITLDSNPWTARQRVAFRFTFTYLGLYVLASQILGSLLLIPYAQFRGLGPHWPMREITIWVAAHLFHIATPLTYSGDSIGETSFFWIQNFWILTAAIAATAIWSVLDRGRTNYDRLYRWFLILIRLSLAAQMFEYGVTKVIPNQFRAPPLVTLIQPVGNQTLEGMLWASIGASQGYEIFLGCAELLGGILLLMPRTATLGALICLADMTQVFVLNMTYDIGLKQVSFHLILLSLFLLSAEYTRLVNFFFLGRPSEASPRNSRSVLALQLVLGIYLIGAQTFINWKYWNAAGGGAPKSALYGIWNVTEISVDGQARTPESLDYDHRWRRVIFDSPRIVAFQRTDDSIAHFGASIDTQTHSIYLTKGSSKTWKSSFNFDRPAQDRLILDGDMDNRRIHLTLQLVDFDSLPLLNSRFRWVRPDKP
jgi:uncharacterized membrane protein YphA (DoxX/SURF4 family)